MSVSRVSKALSTDTDENFCFVNLRGGEILICKCRELMHHFNQQTPTKLLHTNTRGHLQSGMLQGNFCRVLRWVMCISFMAGFSAIECKSFYKLKKHLLFPLSSEESVLSGTSKLE